MRMTLLVLMLLLVSCGGSWTPPPVSYLDVYPPEYGHWKNPNVPGTTCYLCHDEYGG